MTPRMRQAWWAVLVAGIAISGAAQYVPARAGVEGSAWLDLAVGWAYIAGGLVAWARRPNSAMGRLMAATGFAWFIGNFAWSGVPLLTSLGFGFLALHIGMMLHVVLAYPSGKLQTKVERGLFVVGYSVIAIRGIVAVLFIDRDPDCIECPRGFAPWPSVAAEQFFQRSTLIFGVISAVYFALLGRRYVRATPVRRRSLTELWLAGSILLVLSTIELVIFSLGWEPASDGFWNAMTLVQLAIPLSLLVGLFRLQLAKAAVGGLAVELDASAEPPALRAALAHALGDPDVDIVYWIPEQEVFVNEAGKPVPTPTAGPDRGVTMIERRGVRLAAILHDPDLSDRPELVEAAAAATGLMLENTQLQADLRAQLQEVRASRARIVEATDAERVRIERDLHDGAQQRLLSIAFALRAAQRTQEGGNPAVEVALRAAEEELEVAMSEIRELARGIHPAILTEQGLGPALSSLAERAQVPTKVRTNLDGRLSPRLEVTAYFVAAEALTNVAKHARASQAEVIAERRNGELVIEVLDDGVGGANPATGSGLRGLTDRVAAVGGRLIVERSSVGGTRVIAHIPCA